MRYIGHILIRSSRTPVRRSCAVVVEGANPVEDLRLEKNFCGKTLRFDTYYCSRFFMLALSDFQKEYFSWWLLMWPLYLLLNKILGPEDETDQGSDGPPLNVVDTYTFDQLSISEEKDNSVLLRSHFVAVPLVNQQHTWDCGLACVLMVLRTLGINDSNIQDLVDLCCTTSIWTVDLAYLLQKYSVRFSYFTVTLGANPNFNVEKFYEEQLPNDLVRVDTLFKKAVDAGVDIQCRSVSEEEISLLILSGKFVAIALVDLYKLSHSWLEDICIPGLYSGGSEYAGHYIVICGYDAETNEFEIRDPASSSKHEKIPLKRLEEARKSFGTDEDLLLISLE